MSDVYAARHSHSRHEDSIPHASSPLQLGPSNSKNRRISAVACCGQKRAHIQHCIVHEWNQVFLGLYDLGTKMPLMISDAFHKRQLLARHLKAKPDNRSSRTLHDWRLYTLHELLAIPHTLHTASVLDKLRSSHIFKGTTVPSTSIRPHLLPQKNQSSQSTPKRG